MSNQVKSMCRRLAGCNSRDSVRVTMVPGASEPRESGESYYWTTPSGKTRVRYPSAYRWPTVYHASTRVVTVGAEWLSSAIG
jgi:hypothetical protein